MTSLFSLRSKTSCTQTKLFATCEACCPQLDFMCSEIPCVSFHIHSFDKLVNVTEDMEALLLLHHACMCLQKMYGPNNPGSQRSLKAPACSFKLQHSYVRPPRVTAVSIPTAADNFVTCVLSTAVQKHVGRSQPNATVLTLLPFSCLFRLFVLLGLKYSYWV